MKFIPGIDYYTKGEKEMANLYEYLHISRRTARGTTPERITRRQTGRMRRRRKHRKQRQTA